MLKNESKSSFWCVYRDGGGAPTKRHTTEKEALKEAERLAENNPGATFYVLQSVSESFRPPKVVTIRHLEDVPF